MKTRARFLEPHLRAASRDRFAIALASSVASDVRIFSQIPLFTCIFTNAQLFLFGVFCRTVAGVPARKPLSPSEVEICRRIRLVRDAARFSRPIFARFLGLDSSKLSNIENFRVPLDYITANSICRVFRVSARWLMTGKGRPTQVLPTWVYAPISGATGRTLFSQAYSDIEKLVSRAEKAMSAQTEEIARKVKAMDSQPGADLSATGLERSWQEATMETGAADRADVDAQLREAVFGSPFTVEFENELAIVSGFDDKSPMRSVVAPEDLIAQVLRLTEKRGAKTKLATLLQVSRQRLNEWLSGRSKPSARYLLLLINWTRHEQRRARARTDHSKKSAPEVKKARPALTTRKRKIKNEKPSSDRKEK